MASLNETSVYAVVRGFEDALKIGKFTCGGTLCTIPRVQLNYLKSPGQWSGATFPDLHAADLQQLIESSTVASFGKGKETVTDKTYRDAYALDPEKFTSYFFSAFWY